MPIKGLTDKTTPQFPRLGKLRKGAEKSQANRPGAELPHWRFTSEDPDIVRAFTDFYGEAPAEIDVFLPYERLDDNWQTWQEEWVSGGLVHRCDGQTCVTWLENGKYITSDMRQGPPCPGGCKQVGRLALFLTGLARAGFWGHVTMETHSINDLLSIQATLNALAKATDNLQKIPLILRRVEREISTPGNGNKRVRRKKYLVELTLLAEWAQRQIMAGPMRDQLEGGEEDPSEEEDAPPWSDDVYEDTVDEDTGEITDWDVLQSRAWQEWLKVAYPRFGSPPWNEFVAALKEEPALAQPLSDEIRAAAKAQLASHFGEPT